MSDIYYCLSVHWSRPLYYLICYWYLLVLYFYISYFILQLFWFFFIFSTLLVKFVTVFIHSFLSSLSIFTFNTLSSLSGKLHISTPFSSSSGVLSSFGKYFFVALFCLICCVYFCVFDSLVTSTDLREVALCRRCPMGPSNSFPLTTRAVLAVLPVGPIQPFCCNAANNCRYPGR